MIFIVCAMKSELSPILTSLSSYDDIVFVETGVGKINACFGLMNAILKNCIPDIVYNFGTCAGVIGCEIFDVVNGFKISTVDVDYCVGEFIYAQIPNFKNAVLYSNDKFLTIEYYSTICFVLTQHDVVCYDMESFALAKVCDSLNIDFVSIKIVTDNPLSDNSYNDFENNLHEACTRLAIVAKDIIDKRKDAC